MGSSNPPAPPGHKCEPLRGPRASACCCCVPAHALSHCEVHRPARRPAPGSLAPKPGTQTAGSLAAAKCGFGRVLLFRVCGPATRAGRRSRGAGRCSWQEPLGPGCTRKSQRTAPQAPRPRLHSEEPTDRPTSPSAPAALGRANGPPHKPVGPAAPGAQGTVLDTAAPARPSP
jgi:hypothetical protein